MNILFFSNIIPHVFSAVIDDTTKEIVYRDYVDISVAVATPKVRLLLSMKTVHSDIKY